MIQIGLLATLRARRGRARRGGRSLRWRTGLCLRGRRAEPTRCVDRLLPSQPVASLLPRHGRHVGSGSNRGTGQRVDCNDERSRVDCRRQRSNQYNSGRRRGLPGRHCRATHCEGVFNRRLEVEVPYHSPMMQPIMGALQTPCNRLNQPYQSCHCIRRLRANVSLASLLALTIGL